LGDTLVYELLVNGVVFIHVYSIFQRGDILMQNQLGFTLYIDTKPSANKA